jgi:hypothetical protein
MGPKGVPDTKTDSAFKQRLKIFVSLLIDL